MSEFLSIFSPSLQRVLSRHLVTKGKKQTILTYTLNWPHPPHPVTLSFFLSLFLFLSNSLSILPAPPTVTAGDPPVFEIAAPEVHYFQSSLPLVIFTLHLVFLLDAIDFICLFEKTSDVLMSLRQQPCGLRHRAIESSCLLLSTDSKIQ